MEVHPIPPCFTLHFSHFWKYRRSVILTDRLRIVRNDPSWEHNRNIRLSPESIAAVRSTTRYNIYRLTLNAMSIVLPVPRQPR
jgi:hypothetical protein